MSRIRRSQSTSSRTAASAVAGRGDAIWTLVISVGNTSLFGGVFTGSELSKPFRVPTASLVQLPQGVPHNIDRAVVCSVVPAMTPDVVRFIRNSWKIDAQLLTHEA